MAATLDQLLTEVQEITSLEDSILAVVASIKAQLADALSGALTPENQAKVDAIFAALEANKTKLTDAVAANTPAAPTPPVA